MIKDEFQKLRSMINRADALVFSTPVYFDQEFADRSKDCTVVHDFTGIFDLL